jgi:TolB-like protein
MKYLLRLLILFPLICNCLFSQVKKQTLAVLEFQKAGLISNDDVVTLTNRFRAMLVQTNSFDVIERERMSDILKEQNFILSDACNTDECAVKVGQLLGVEYMVAGDIGKIGDTYTIDIRMIDVSTGKLIQTKSRDYIGKIDGLLDIMKNISFNADANRETTRDNLNKDDSKTKSPLTKMKVVLRSDVAIFGIIIKDEGKWIILKKDDGGVVNIAREDVREIIQDKQ